MAAAHLSTEEENYVRMSLLITGVSPRGVRALFDSEFAPIRLDASIKKEYTKLKDLKSKHIINQSQWNLLFPRYPGRYRNLILILLNQTSYYKDIVLRKEMCLDK